MNSNLSDLKLVLGPHLRILYYLILSFAVSDELEFLHGSSQTYQIKAKASSEPEHGVDSLLDLASFGSEWQFNFLSHASNWQDKLVVISIRSVEQNALSPTEAAKVFESQLAESILEGDGQNLQPQHLKP